MSVIISSSIASCTRSLQIQTETSRQSDKQTVGCSVRQKGGHSVRQTGARSVSQTGTCTVRWWASRSSTPAEAASGLRLSCCSDPLWGPQTAARPPWTWWWRECEWLIWAVSYLVSFGKIGQSQASHFPLIPVFMLSLLCPDFSFILIGQDFLSCWELDEKTHIMSETPGSDCSQLLCDYVLDCFLVQHIILVKQQLAAQTNCTKCKKHNTHTHIPCPGRVPDNPPAAQTPQKKSVSERHRGTLGKDWQPLQDILKVAVLTGVL